MLDELSRNALAVGVLAIVALVVAVLLVSEGIGEWRKKRAAIAANRAADAKSALDAAWAGVPDSCTPASGVSNPGGMRENFKTASKFFFALETEREEDGRWIAEVPALSGVMAYGKTESEAVATARALAFRVIADRIEHGESIPAEARELFVVA